MKPHDARTQKVSSERSLTDILVEEFHQAHVLLEIGLDDMKIKMKKQKPKLGSSTKKCTIRKL